jgi:hypothetical protein
MIRRLAGLLLILGSLVAAAARPPPTNANDPCSNACISQLTECMKGCGLDPGKPPKDPKTMNMPCLKKCSGAQQACQRKCK